MDSSDTNQAMTDMNDIPQYQDSMPPFPQDPNAYQDMTDGMDAQGGKSQYDTNFDAGVEADEDEDPKKYIQQLTGKLSQELNKFNNENGNDKEISKYVGKMIVKAAAKALDEKGRKDLIKSINSCKEADDSEEADEADDGADDIEKSMDNNNQKDIPQTMMEKVLTKKQLLELVGVNNKDDNEENELERKSDAKKTNTPKKKIPFIAGKVK